MSKRLFGSLVTGALALSLVVPAAASPTAQQNTTQPTKRDRELITQARAEGNNSVKLLIAAENGQNSTVVSGI
jgi:hypothetical protein